MDDDFLSGFRQPPTAEFAQGLLARLVDEEKARKKTRDSTWKRVGFAFAALCLALTVLLLVSPAARTAAQQVINDILGKITLPGITVFVSSDRPSPSEFPPELESYEVIWTPLSPDEISSGSSDLARLPAWLPPAYALQGRAALFYQSYPTRPIPPDMAVFQWKSRAGDIIQLMVDKTSCSYEQSLSDCASHTYVAMGINDEPQVITVNGHSGIIFSGMTFVFNLSDPVKQWNPARERLVPQGLTMMWRDDVILFWITTNSPEISRDDLMRLAESIP